MEENSWNHLCNYCVGKSGFLSCGDDLITMKSHLLLKNRVHEFRVKKGLSQSDLAKLVGSSRNTISSIETGQFSPSAYLAAILCAALDCKFEDLFYLDEDK